MGDSYKEILIKKETTAKDKVIKVGLIGFVILLILGGLLISQILLLAGVAAGVASYLLLLPRLDIEYEYLYVNGELDIDVIYSKQKRKKAASYDLREAEMLAPENSHALDPYKKGKTIDYTSGTNTGTNYIAVIVKENQTMLVKLELDEEILQDVRRYAPRKVSLT